MILAGGKGTRLYPLTQVMNKHLLPIGGYPMIYWPIFKLKEAGVTEILLTTHHHDMLMFKKLLGNGECLGVRLHYQIQQEAKGIPDAIYLAKEFAGEAKLIVVLGDNIFHDSLEPYVKSFEQQADGAMVLLKWVPDPQRYGIAQFNKSEHTIVSIQEKPEVPPSNYCVTGIYMYDKEVFNLIEQITPSERGELEITDVNNLYIKQNKLTYDFLEKWWIDAGTYDSFYQANKLANQNADILPNAKGDFS